MDLPTNRGMWDSKTVLLVHPPVAKPCEPPPGIARLSAALFSHGIDHHILDANLECLMALMARPISNQDTWTKRATQNRKRNLVNLRTRQGYTNIDRYKRAVADLNHLLSNHRANNGIRLTLADFRHPTLSPLRSDDLLSAAEHPEKSPFYQYFTNRLAPIIEKHDVSIVGFSLNYLSQALSAFAMIGFVRQTYPDVITVLGGSLITSWVRGKSWRNPFGGMVDHVVAGPGEGPLLNILGKELNPRDCHRPEYSLFSLSDYLAPGTITPYSASTGCYWNRCLFCPERTENNPYMPIHPSTVAEDLRSLTEAMRPCLVHLVDNGISPTLMETLCTNPPGAPWYAFTRVTPQLADPDFCMALKRSGCVMLKLGVESGSQTVLDSMHKGNDIACSSAVLKSLTEAGIATYIYLLFGTPWETYSEAQDTLKFVIDHGQYIDFLNIALFNLPIGSPEAKQLKTEVFYEGDLSLYAGFTHPKGWDRGTVRMFLDKEFKRHPVVRRLLRRHPPIFGSQHAPFFITDRK